MPPVVNIFFMLALFGKVGFVAPDLALKIWSAWGLFNGLFCYASPSTFMSLSSNPT